MSPLWEVAHLSASKPSCNPSDPFARMTLQVCERILLWLFSLRAKYPEPDSVDLSDPDLSDLSGLIDIEGLLKRCIIEHVIGRFLRVLQEICRKEGRIEQAGTKRSLEEQLVGFWQSQGHSLPAAEQKVKQERDEVIKQAVISRYPRLPERRLRDRRLRDSLVRRCTQLDKELRQQCPRCPEGDLETCILEIVQACLANPDPVGNLQLQSRTEKNVSNSPSSRRRRRPANIVVEHRTRIILAVVATRVRGKAYAEAIAVRLQTPIPWQKEGCPKDYVDAWNDPSGKWRSRIDDERRNAIARKKSIP